jgi:ParB-like chromosome segregation protein Spo0J
MKKPKTTTLQVEQWPTSKLLPYARNPRKNDEQVDRMAGAIREFGFRIPVVAKSDGTIVDGHLRLKAAMKLGMETVPVALADELTEAQVKAFRILANKSANWAEWDTELLAVEMEELAGMAYDLNLTGFDQGEIDALLVRVDPLSEMPTLPSGEREPFQQMTFTLHDDQVVDVRGAIEIAKDLGPFLGPNENSNGNALARICEEFISQHG